METIQQKSNPQINIYYSDSIISLLIKIITMIKKENNIAKILIIFLQKENIEIFDKFLWTKALWLPHCKLNDDISLDTNIILTDYNTLPRDFSNYNYHFVIDENLDSNQIDNDSATIFYNSAINLFFNKLSIITNIKEDLKIRYTNYLDLKKNNFIIKLYKEDSNGIFNQLN
jgi:hypothetical protein